MNRVEKVAFIKTNHSKLYESLEANVPNFFKDVWGAHLTTINMYNCWVVYYCANLRDLKLMHSLLID